MKEDISEKVEKTSRFLNKSKEFPETSKDSLLKEGLIKLKNLHDTIYRFKNQNGSKEEISRFEFEIEKLCTNDILRFVNIKYKNYLVEPSNDEKSLIKEAVKEFKIDAIDSQRFIRDMFNLPRQFELNRARCSVVTVSRQENKMLSGTELSEIDIYAMIGYPNEKEPREVNLHCLLRDYEKEDWSPLRLEDFLMESPRYIYSKNSVGQKPERHKAEIILVGDEIWSSGPPNSGIRVSLIFETGDCDLCYMADVISRYEKEDGTELLEQDILSKNPKYVYSKVFTTFRDRSRLWVTCLPQKSINRLDSTSKCCVKLTSVEFNYELKETALDAILEHYESADGRALLVSDFSELSATVVYEKNID